MAPVCNQDWSSEIQNKMFGLCSSDPVSHENSKRRNGKKAITIKDAYLNFITYSFNYPTARKTRSLQGRDIRAHFFYTLSNDIS